MIPKRKPVDVEEVIDMIFKTFVKIDWPITKEGVMELFDEDSHLKAEIDQAFTILMSKGVDYCGARIKLIPNFRKKTDDGYMVYEIA